METFQTEKASFLNRMVERDQISLPNALILDASGARTPSTILSLLTNFPSLSKEGLLDASAISNSLYRHGGSSARMFFTRIATESIDNARRQLPHGTLGAKAPSTAIWKIGETVPVPNLDSDRIATAALIAHLAGDSIDNRACLPWPVRNQHDRGTCVAFAMCALREALACEAGQAVDLSEQFLYWATKIKIGDQWPHEDGTLIEDVAKALQKYGICIESLCDYKPDFVKGDPGQDKPPRRPTATAVSSAGSYAHRPAICKDGKSKGNAAEIRSALENGRPVAVSLPVFSDPLIEADLNNWNSPTGLYYGEVLDPPPTSVASSGHAVCLTGFSADPNEPLGGYFIIRNSWGAHWGRDLPSRAYYGPEAGYGQVSASYVDKFLWEWAQL